MARKKKHRKRSARRDDTSGARREALPTTAQPGSAEKIAELTRRQGRGLALFARGDVSRDDERRAVVRPPLAQRIYDARVRLGWKQQTLAVRAGLTKSAVCRLEAGQRTPGAVTLIALATALGVAVNVLLGVEALRLA